MPCPLSARVHLLSCTGRACLCLAMSGREATALPLRFANDFVDLVTRCVTTVGHVTKYRHKKLSATKRHTRHKKSDRPKNNFLPYVLFCGYELISSMRQRLMMLEEMSVAPLSCIRLSSCLPRSSMKLTLVRSIRSEDHLSGASCQHLSNSSTHAPASFPSRTRRVSAASL